MSYYKRDDGRTAPGVIQCGAWIAAPGTWYRPGPPVEHALLWILDGSAIVECQGETYAVPPNGIYCAPPGVEYVVRWDLRRTTRWGWLNFTAPEGVDLPRLRPARADDILIPLLDHMVALSIDKPPGWTESLRTVYEYAVRVYASGHSSTRIAHDSVYSELMVRAIATIQRHWRGSPMTALPLGELAAELGVTPRHLTRVFEKEIGVAPIAALRTLRILRAAQMLADSNRPIREIAAYVGFANHYHFSTVFKATIGVPPGEYRYHAPERTLVPAQVERLIGYF